LHDPFLPKWLHRIDVPVKIIWGREDRILPVAFVDEFKRLMPKAQIHIVDNAGHLPHAEKPDQFVELVCR
jgi:pimeloyl-ACP methyl ester carboxylesterase